MAEAERTLHQRLRQGLLDLRDAAAIIDDVLGEVAKVHAGGLVDRSLTPERVVLYRGADRLRARLEEPARRRDRKAAEPDLSAMDAALAAFPCMAPEQVRGNTDVDRRADIYAVGVIAFAALTGRFPFERMNALVLIARKLEGAPPTLESARGRPFAPLLELFVTTAMAGDRDRRYPRIEVARAAWREATR
jgi:serine/threonine-protein kinase